MAAVCAVPKTSVSPEALYSFGRGTIDAEASYQDDVEAKDFIGILDFPSGFELAASENGVEDYTGVGDFAGLRDEPLGVEEHEEWAGGVAGDARFDIVGNHHLHTVVILVYNHPCNFSRRQSIAYEFG